MQCFQGFTEKLINTAFVKIVFAGFDSPQVHPEKLDFIGLFLLSFLTVLHFVCVLDKMCGLF